MQKTPKFRSYEGSDIEWVDTSQVDTGSTYRVVDLFAGAGGLSLGFGMAGYEPVLAVEADADAYATYANNFPGTRLHTGLIEDLSEYDLLALFPGAPPDVICGGPPCQSHSTAGKRDPADPRGHLYQEFLRVAGILRPHFLVMENVPGLLSIEQGGRIQRILDGLAGIGYPDGSVMMLESAEFGVPQMRRRLFIVANRYGRPNPRPLPLLSRRRFIPVECAINDLKGRPRDPATNHEWTRHTSEMEMRLARVAPGETLYDGYSGSWRRLRIGLPSPTIKHNNGAPHIHYELPRTISAREMARLQSFPDSFRFSGEMASAMVQVGNAVPPLLAKAIGLALRPSLEAISGVSPGQPGPPPIAASRREERGS
ncbi:MAG: DNA cytosine methyltransferase [Armatimonadia bacterium]